MLTSIITYAYPVWDAVSHLKIKKLQTIQNKLLRVALKAPWFMRQRQLHNDIKIP